MNMTRQLSRAIARRMGKGKPALLAAEQPRVNAQLLNRGTRRFELGRTDLPAAFAAVGRNHPDYGLSPAEHEQMKWARAQGWAEPQSFESVEAAIRTIAEVEEGGAS